MLLVTICVVICLHFLACCKQGMGRGKGQCVAVVGESNSYNFVVYFGCVRVCGECGKSYASLPEKLLEFRADSDLGRQHGQRG